MNKLNYIGFLFLELIIRNFLVIEYLDKKIEHQKLFEGILEGAKKPKTYDKMSNVEQLEFSQKNLKADLKLAKEIYKDIPSFGNQGRINDINSQLKAIGFQLSAGASWKDLLTPIALPAPSLYPIFLLSLRTMFSPTVSSVGSSE